MKPETRLKVNIIIDILMFVVMVALAVIGFLIRYVLLSGEGRWERFGENLDMTLFGLDRHEWGFIHLILGISLSVLLILHIVFHWKQIVCMIRRLIPKTRIRVAFVSVLVLLSTFLVFVLFFLRPEIGEPIHRQGRGAGRNAFFNSKAGTMKQPGTVQVTNPEGQRVQRGRSRRSVEEIPAAAEQQDPVREAPEAPAAGSHEHREEHSLHIRGFHTLGEVADNHHVPVEVLKSRLDIPPGVSRNERLGRLRRSCGFTMGDVEKIVLSLLEEQKQ